MAEKVSSKKVIILRIFIAFIILAGGEGLRRYLASFKKAPAQNEIEEKTYTVRALEVSKSEHLIYLEGYGIISSSEIVNVSTEISGIITYVNPKLELGLTIEKDEVLFKIQEKDYQLAVVREESRIKTLNSQIDELKTEIEFASKNLELQDQQVYLSKRDLDRQNDLLKQGVGSIVTKEAKELTYINAQTLLLSTKQRISSAKNKISTIKNQIMEAEVILKLNQNNLDKCVVKAPSKLRVVKKNIEKGQLATPGLTLITLENDQRLEIPVMISGPDVVRWLKLENNKNNLFQSLTKSHAEIYWTEAKNNEILAKGSLTRIQNYDSSNRMVKGLVQIDSLKGIAASGMFCKVKIAGRQLQEVYKVPRVSLNQKDELITIESGRLKLIKVEAVYDAGDFQYVKSAELKDTILVIDNKLATPIEGLKVQLEEQ